MVACRPHLNLAAPRNGALSLSLETGLVRLPVDRRRYASASVNPNPMLEPSTPIAKQLLGQGEWRLGTRQKKIHDASRVNIASQALCDDIVKYIGPSLERHVGCDILDMYPGSGVWSRTLHDLLQPRSHILMEPDAEFYEPFLRPLLEKPNTKLVPQSGIVFTELKKLTDYLPNQVPAPAPADSAAGPPRRNDTLLVTANLGFCKPKKFGSFASAPRLVLYQFISSIRRSTLFQRYGLVRMLMWVDDGEATLLVPRGIKHRKKLAVETELSCEWVHLVVRPDMDRLLSASRLAGRDHWIDWDSAKQTLARMRTADISMPAGRETNLIRQVAGSGEDLHSVIAGTRPPVVGKSTDQEFDTMDPDDDNLKDRRKYIEMMQKGDLKHSALFLELLRDRKTIIALYKSGADPARAREWERSWDARVDGLMQNIDKRLLICRDNLHIFQQSPPVLMWDRRAYEPLAALAADFFPKFPLSLLDVQPRAPHELLREVGPNSTRAGDMFDLMMQSTSPMRRAPFSSAIGMLWPGAADHVLPRVTSLQDPDRGGVPSTLHGNFGLTVRTLNQEQWIDFVEQWMKWPFRPDWLQLMSRFGDNNVTMEHNASLFPGQADMF